MPGVYVHVRAFWGLFDETYVTSEYSGSALVSAGASAAPDVGVGVRRAILVFNRLPPGIYSDDDAQMHMDFMNITGGTPDDTWILGDYEGIEGHITDWWTATRAKVSTRVTLKEIRWYRVGIGVPDTNPAERVTSVDVAGASTGLELPPQVSCTLTIHTARRKQWGRTYLPGPTASHLDTGGVMTAADTADLGVAWDALAQACADDETFLGVYSKTAGSFFGAEQVAVDNIYDIIRRRRWRNPTERFVYPS